MAVKQSTFRGDLKSEGAVNEFLQKYFYEWLVKNNIIKSFYHVEDCNAQREGVDTVVEINKGGGQTINDGASGTNRATESVMIFAEGVFYNPRKVLTGGTYNKEAYGRGESTTGQKSISDFN